MGFEGKPLACRNASREELKAYANQLKKRGKGAIEIALTRQVGVLEQDQCELLDFLLTESGRPVTFIALFDRDDIPEAVRDTLRRAAPMIAKGARPQTSPLPLTREVDMNNPFSFAAFPSWKRVFADTSQGGAEEGLCRSRPSATQFRHDLKNPTGFSNWGRIGVYAVKNPALKQLEGKSIAEIAQEQGKDGVDAFLDLVLADDLECELTMASWNTREDRMRELLNNKSILMALGDGGAHVDMLCDAGYPTYLLGTWVREKQAITLEEGVRKLTSDPADLFGLKDRGRLAKGAPADVAIFDPGRIGSNNHGERRYDLPGGAKRIVMPSRGVEYTVVNGAVDLGAGQAHRGQGRQGAARIGPRPSALAGDGERFLERRRGEHGQEGRERHLAADALRLRRARDQPSLLDGGAELGRRERRQVGLRHQVRQVGGVEAGGAAVEQPHQLAYQDQAGAQGPVGCAAQPGLQQQPFQFGRAGEEQGEDRHIDQRVVAVCRLPVDQPQPLAVEQDIAGVRVVVAGDQRSIVPRVGLADALEAFLMPVEQAWGEKTRAEQATQQGLSAPRDSR